MQPSASRIGALKVKLVELDEVAVSAFRCPTICANARFSGLDTALYEQQ